MDLIEKSSLTPENLIYLKNAQLSVQSLLHISNDILDVARLEAGIFKLEEKKFSFRKALQETFDILVPDIEAKKLKFKAEIDSKIPYKLSGDPLRLRQIVFNLLSNSLKFTSTGTIEVNFQGYPHPQNVEQFILLGQVKDTGIGMTASTIQKLFKPFAQGDSAVYRQFGGMGLGLHLTRQICETMGGKIAVESQVDQGTTFSFEIILRQIKSLHASSDDANEPFPSLNILVAEDNMMIQKIFKITLGKLGCYVTIACNGLEALKAVKTHAYDVVLMDGEMPIMDGLEATRQIRQYLGSKFLPIIGVTAHGLPTDRIRFLESGMNGYMTKPVKMIDLQAEILRCLALKKKHDSGF